MKAASGTGLGMPHACRGVLHVGGYLRASPPLRMPHACRGEAHAAPRACPIAANVTNPTASVGHPRLLTPALHSFLPNALINRPVATRPAETGRSRRRPLPW